MLNLIVFQWQAFLYGGTVGPSPSQNQYFTSLLMWKACMYIKYSIPVNLLLLTFYERIIV